MLRASGAAPHESVLDEGESNEQSAPADINEEYGVWFSPGQFKPMGQWVLRTEEAFDHAAMVKAAQLLTDRHSSLRVRLVDPLRYMSEPIYCIKGMPPLPLVSQKRM